MYLWPQDAKYLAHLSASTSMPRLTALASLPLAPGGAVGSDWGVSSRGGSHWEPLGAIGSHQEPQTACVCMSSSHREPPGATGSHWESFEAWE